ncbi:MAG: phospholipase D-like domain-containing protein [Candidatus Bipolaricaulota bacterium]|nr:phospholipase D-like domain-containing protein [Candidatus Bipolaricaulota bacterium]MDW8126620.1 phospholipase D-like domain-containing protein [Candidatus Bipolaricaulota bacterium]
MRVLATGFSFFLWSFTALGFPVLPLWTTPQNPCYLQHVPEVLARAKEEVLVALSDLRAYEEGTSEPLLSTLCTLAKAGVAIYVLVERGNRPLAPEQERAVTRLRLAGAKVQEDPVEITLHAKFLVVDCYWVIVGSTHWTKTALTASIQVDLALAEPTLAATFRRFFFYLWEGKLTTQTQLPGKPWPEAAAIPVLDFPETRTHFNVIQFMLECAQTEILVLLYQLTFYPGYPDSPSTVLIQTLARAAQRGVRVQILLEGGETDQSLADSNRLSAAWLTSQGVEVRFDSAQTTMHAKCLVVDGRHVLVSSANWNYSSLAKNVEAGLALLGTPELGHLLAAYFDELWRGSFPLR